MLGFIYNTVSLLLRSPTHLYVLAVISGSHLEKVAHLLLLTALYLPAFSSPRLLFWRRWRVSVDEDVESDLVEKLMSYTDVERQYVGVCL